jgi:acyl-CoA thioester hydrolase
VTGTGVTPTSGFVSYVRVRFNECDPLGHVNNAVYLNYLEQVAIDHAAARGLTSSALIEQAGALFVARKHEIEYHRPAFEGDLLQVRTWPTEMRGARGSTASTTSAASTPPRTAPASSTACWNPTSSSRSPKPTSSSPPAPNGPS